MKINWKFIGGYALGVISMCFLAKAFASFPDDTQEGWACVVLSLCVCGVTAAYSMEKP